MTDDVQWRIHYMTPKVEGGNNNLSNLQVTHHDCHKKIHRQTLEVVKPAAEKAAYERLEPCVGKLTSTVLTGLGFSNGPWLPSSEQERLMPV
jgi:hypothetical protein